ncbi:RNA binding protein [Aspergillus sclerotialis]|uniref:RNA binding protein n=1 Tax=Aspergillus sclerotialis TaxID=2070753 RepID=A0A3A3A690_9EURO|nr:RNA binding protein [Aspergillus sclerotialis]
MEANSGDNEGKPSEEGNEGDAKDVASLNFVDSEPMKLDEPDTKEAEKKEKKEKKKAKKEKQGTTKGETNDLNNSHQGEPTSKPQEELATGNLPFTANVDSVSKHFAKNPPSEIRIATERNHPEKCRGFGFVEFENFDRMKSCLKLYHHSSFDDGKSPVRRINVELTAGGGGKSKNRKAKIEAKNERLEGQRKRAVEQLQQEKAKKAEIKEKGGKDDFAGVHPSRLSRMA